MKLNFIQVQFNLKFSEPALADTNPLFILRSMMGKNLRTMCCISKKSVCHECQFHRTCVYAFLFETILTFENPALPGRNRGSHPYSFSNKNQNWTNPFEEYSFNITLFGNAIKYLPYIYASFVQSGKNGLFKSRTKFAVKSVITNEKNILIDENHLDMDFETDKWKCDFENRNSSEAADCKFQNKLEMTDDVSEILINLKSPLRFKVQGKYTADFSAKDFMNCIFRRAKTLCSLYGETSDEEKNLWKISADRMEITERNLRWIDERHYSARQKKAMELGGVAGTFKMEGNFTDAEIALLDFAEIAGAGKNTNFGLGQMEVWGK